MPARVLEGPSRASGAGGRHGPPGAAGPGSPLQRGGRGRTDRAEHGARPAAPRDPGIPGPGCPARPAPPAASEPASYCPFANAGMMNLHPAEIGTSILPGAHAVPTIGGAGWPQPGGRLHGPGTITLRYLPPRARSWARSRPSGPFSDPASSAAASSTPATPSPAPASTHGAGRPGSRSASPPSEPGKGHRPAAHAARMIPGPASRARSTRASATAARGRRDAASLRKGLVPWPATGPSPRRGIEAGDGLTAPSAAAGKPPPVTRAAGAVRRIRPTRAPG